MLTLIPTREIDAILLFLSGIQDKAPSFNTTGKFHPLLAILQIFCRGGNIIPPLEFFIASDIY